MHKNFQSKIHSCWVANKVGVQQLLEVTPEISSELLLPCKLRTKWKLTVNYYLLVSKDKTEKSQHWLLAGLLDAWFQNENNNELFESTIFLVFWMSASTICYGCFANLDDLFHQMTNVHPFRCNLCKKSHSGVRTNEMNWLKVKNLIQGYAQIRWIDWKWRKKT